MAVLDQEARDEIPKAEFGLPAERKYPLSDATHAVNAKGRAKQQLDKGRLTGAQYREIVRKADAALKRMK